MQFLVYFICKCFYRTDKSIQDKKNILGLVWSCLLLGMCLVTHLIIAALQDGAFHIMLVRFAYYSIL